MCYRCYHRFSLDERHARRVDERERRRRSSPEDSRMRRERSRSPSMRLVRFNLSYSSTVYVYAFTKDIYPDLCYAMVISDTLDYTLV